MDVNCVLQAESEPCRAYPVLVKHALIISIDEMVNWQKKSMERMQIHDHGPWMQICDRLEGVYTNSPGGWGGPQQTIDLRLFKIYQFTNQFLFGFPVLFC